MRLPSWREKLDLCRTDILVPNSSIATNPMWIFVLPPLHPDILFIPLTPMSPPPHIVTDLVPAAEQEGELEKTGRDVRRGFSPSRAEHDARS